MTPANILCAEICNNKVINPLSANPTKWSNTLKQFVERLSVFDHFVILALKGLTCCKALFRCLQGS